MEITFIDKTGIIPEEYYVSPAIKEIPDWYKKTNPYMGGSKPRITEIGSNSTIKKCIPLFDAMSAGYIIKTYVDVQVTKYDGLPYYSWPTEQPIDFHPIEQAKKYPNLKKNPIPKWNSPWIIKTKKGYSCLFLPPLHRDNDIFTIFSGIVDTEKYCMPVNFPFTLNDPDWEGIIPAGTPIAQVIPFKRDNFKMNFLQMNDKIANEIKRENLKIKSKIIGAYKNFFWSRKQYI